MRVTGATPAARITAPGRHSQHGLRKPKQTIRRLCSGPGQYRGGRKALGLRGHSNPSGHYIASARYTLKTSARPATRSCKDLNGWLDGGSAPMFSDAFKSYCLRDRPTTASTSSPTAISICRWVTGKRLRAEPGPGDLARRIQRVSGRCLAREPRTIGRPSGTTSNTRESAGDPITLRAVLSEADGSPVQLQTSDERLVPEQGLNSHVGVSAASPTEPAPGSICHSWYDDQFVGTGRSTRISQPPGADYYRIKRRR